MAATIKMAATTAFRFWLLSLFDSMNVFYSRVTLSLLNLTFISQIVKKFQLFTEIQDGGIRHLEFWQLCIFSVDVFEIEVQMFPLILVTIGQIVKKWQPFFEIQDGGDRHLEFVLTFLLTFHMAS